MAATDDAVGGSGDQLRRPLRRPGNERPVREEPTAVPRPPPAIDYAGGLVGSTAKLASSDAFCAAILARTRCPCTS